MEPSDWGSLPGHLLDCMLMKSRTRADFIHCTAVCRKWLLEAKKQVHLLYNLPQVPFLLVPAGDNESEDSSRTLYDVCCDRICPSITWEVPLPTRYCGSSFGCLIFMRRKLEVVIWNPVRGSPPIFLPTLVEFVTEWGRDYDYEFQMQKVILSADPYSHPENCVVAALTACYCRLFFIKLGDPSWIPLPDEVYDPGLHDVVYHQGSFYCVNSWGSMFRILVHGDSLTVLNRMRNAYECPTTFTYLIIVSNGDFLMVHKNINQYKASHFSVLRLETSQASIEEEYTWVSTNNLGGDAIFLGTNHGVAVQARDFFGCRSGCIYYTDDLVFTTTHTNFGPVDLGVFELGSSSFSHHYRWKPCHKYMAPAIWIVPTPLYPLIPCDQA